MTNEPEQQRKKAQRYDLEVGTAVVAGAFIVVLLLHILGVWGLIHGMGNGESPPPPVHPPIQTRVLPHLRRRRAPPPPKIEVPPPPKPPMKHVARTPPKQPVAPPTQTAKAPPADTLPNDSPDTTAGTSPLNNVRPVYPPEMEEDNIEGRVTIVCDVETTGMTSNCRVQSVTGGQAFAQSALDYVRKARYRPASRNGVPVRELNKTYVIRFRLDD